jgi:hypothetical protein
MDPFPLTHMVETDPVSKTYILNTFQLSVFSIAIPTIHPGIKKKQMEYLTTMTSL